MSSVRNFFSVSLLQQIIIQIILTGGVFFFFQKSFENSLVEARLNKEIFMKEKRTVYDKALEIAYRQIAIEEYDQNGRTGEIIKFSNRLRGASRPSELEINFCFAKLYMYAGDIEILNSFGDIVAPKSKPYSPVPIMKKMLQAMNKDLGNKEPKNYDLLYVISDTLPH